MKDFICVSCWGTFQVDETRLANASSVACPTCGASQPVTSSVKAAARRATSPALPASSAAPPAAEEGGATMEIELPAQLASDLKAGFGGLTVPAPKAQRQPKRTDKLATYKIGGNAAPSDATHDDFGSGDDDAGDIEGGATMEMQMPAGLLEELQASAGAKAFAGLAAPAPRRPAPPTAPQASLPPAPQEAQTTNGRWDSTPRQPAPPAAPAQAAPPTPSYGVTQQPTPVAAPPIAPAPLDEPVGRVGAIPPSEPIVSGAASDSDIRRDSSIWRMRMRSGLVLSFPTFEMVAAWAADKPADQIQISLGNSNFRPYETFLDALDETGSPADAIALINGEVRPATEPGAVLPEVASEPTMSTARSATIMTNRTGGPSSPDALAAAAAAAARRAAGKSPTQLQPQFKFRTTEKKSPWPAVVLVVVIGAAAVAGALFFMN